MANTALSKENIWVNKSTYDKAEQLHFERIAKMNGIEVLVGASTTDVGSRLSNLEQEHNDLKNVVEELKNAIHRLEIQVREVEGIRKSPPEPFIAICPAKPTKNASKKDEEEDDMDLFASDSEGEDAEANKIREQRLAEYNAKKSKKPVLIAKSNIILDVKPWDDETDLVEMEKEVRKISSDGLLWGAAKHVPLAYGIHKLQISCVVEDDKVSVDWLTDTIQSIEDHVQSVDIAAFNKV